MLLLTGKSHISKKLLNITMLTLSTSMMITALKIVYSCLRIYGDRLTFCGGFDTQGVLDVPGVTAEKVKAEYRKVINDLAPHKFRHFQEQQSQN